MRQLEDTPSKKKSAQVSKFQIPSGLDDAVIWWAHAAALGLALVGIWCLAVLAADAISGMLTGFRYGGRAG
jgi:hypothetical protein